MDRSNDSMELARIVRVSLLDADSILLDFSNNASALFPIERLKQLVLQSPDSITYADPPEPDQPDTDRSEKHKDEAAD